MPTLDEQISEALAEAERNGELRAAPSWGRPMPVDEAWERTPEALRMPYKILKDAGLVPPEIALFREIATLQPQADAGDVPARQRIAELRQRLALRLEKLRASSSF